MNRTLLVCISLILCFSCLRAANEDLEAEINGIMGKYHAIGASVVTVRDNRVVYTHTFGYSPDYMDSIRREPIPSDGIFVIQSISKTFISTAIMQLAEKKRLRLDDDVNKYLPFQVRNPKYPNIPITVRMLMSHRSSINDKHYGWTFTQINPQTGKKWKECYNDYLPGTKFSYCNFNYNLLGAIIESVTGERFFDYIDKHITQPLGLDASFNLTKIDSTRLVRALPYDKTTKTFVKDKSSIYDYSYYRKQLKSYKLGVSTACFSPSGGMKISAVDLAKYMMMHMNMGKYNGTRILKKKSEKEMRQPLASDTTFAMGFFRDETILRGEPIVGVRGSAHGIHSAMYFSPKKKFGFVVICNGCIADRKMKNEVAWVLYKHLIKDND